jgi:hypothetical protein
MAITTHMNRLLTLARFVYGDAASRLVFEPLLADAQSEIERARWPILARVRWQIAMIIALVSYSPRMAAVPAPLLIDLVVRGVIFGGIAIVLQLAFAWSGAPGVPVSFVSTLPFVVMPIIWRVRVSSLPHYHRRCVAVVITAGGAITMAILSGGALEMRVALAAMAVGVASTGWAMGNPNHGKDGVYVDSVVFQGVKIGSTYYLAGWFPLLASGHSVFDSYWPGRLVFTQLIGIAISASVIKRWHATDNKEAS